MFLDRLDAKNLVVESITLDNIFLLSMYALFSRLGLYEPRNIKHQIPTISNSLVTWHLR